MTALSDEAIRRLQAAARWPAFDGSRYTIVGEIGRGGMGTVYLARDETLGRDVAIKVSNALDHAALESRLRTESRALAHLEHPGIVPIHDVGRLADGRLFYVMKRVRGQTLVDHLGEGVELDERLRLFERITEPVAFAHAQGFIHRDLKPANVMVGPFGEILVLDWGVAKVVRHAGRLASDAPADADIATGIGAVAGHARDTTAGTSPGTILGTRGFMAPEQASGRADEVDERADVYGLGGILFTILTGQVPPGAATDRHRALDACPGAPRPLRAICLMAMAATPADRYPTAAALAADVRRFRAGDPVEAYRERWYERLARVARRYQVAIMLVAAYLLMRALFALYLRR